MKTKVVSLSISTFWIGSMIKAKRIPALIHMECLSVELPCGRYRAGLRIMSATRHAMVFIPVKTRGEYALPPREIGRGQRQQYQQSRPVRPACRDRRCENLRYGRGQPPP